MPTAHPVPSTNEPSLCLEWGIQAKAVLPHPHQVQHRVLCPSPNPGHPAEQFVASKKTP